jgi:hypothetical protein
MRRLEGRIQRLFRGESGETVDVGLEDRAARGERCASAFALHFDEAGLAELFEVMGDGGGTDDVMLVEGAAGGAVSGGDLLEDGEASRIGEGSSDGVKLFVG